LQFTSVLNRLQKNVGAAGFQVSEIDPNDIKLVKKIGSGCFGTVWKGLCYQKEVAIKVPLVQTLTTKQLQNFRREVKIMCSHPHPNICLFMGACTQPGQFKIVTELMDGDVETLLHSNENLSLYERMKMAKDAALGMNWLHCSDPPIIHRDLKTANLLMEKLNFEGQTKYRVKLCDFGLAEIKEGAFMQDGKDGAKGTPLWMPPEVMMGHRFDEKSDVYSFGIVLWEILTRKEPFPHHDDYDTFTAAICKLHERPPIPESCPNVLRKLLEDCWAPVPADRLDFEEINTRLDVVLVHAAIADEQGRSFWETNFLQEEEVPGEEFLEKFYQFMGLDLPEDNATEISCPYQTFADTGPDDCEATIDQNTADNYELSPSPPPSEEVISLRCLKELLFAKDSNSENWVNVEKFGQILHWFGPLGKDSQVLDQIYNTLKHDWFHGDIPTGEAVRRLQGQKSGCFLVRFSNNPSHPGCYTISRVSSRKTVAHIRILHSPSEGFSLNDDNQFEALEELVAAVSSRLDLRFPCPGSTYSHIFSGSSLSGTYQEDHSVL